ncbi:LamG-like jellyroll fold domain-containing protein [uncultured Lacinutrix sp.]|uniref:LamG-like jellyroll fold domain-containing protein n=1 Tax=uncultured Lacinutrix sp. TaxID=574032 RepID=UPI002615CF0C|nr:LamG-like jellyroll fold domain-containing protein [uncultured Lacinutrix sp.]
MKKHSLLRSSLLILFFTPVSLFSQVHLPPSCGENYSLEWSSSPIAQNEYNWSSAGALTSTYTNVDNSGVDFTVTFTGDTSSFGAWNGLTTPVVGNDSSPTYESLDLFTNGYSASGITCTITFSSPIYALSFDINHINTSSVNGDKYTISGINTNGDIILPTFTSSSTPSYTADNSTGIVNSTGASVSGNDGTVGVNFSDNDYITSVSFLWQDCDTCSPNNVHGSGLGNFSFCIPQTLDFDGNNDYINRAPFLSNKTESSMMSWIKLKNGFDGGDIMGQKNYRLFVDNSNKLRAEIETNTPSLVNYRIDMRDSYGDGWTNKGVLITINGATLNGGVPYTVHDAGLSNTPITNSENFTAYEGDIIEITFTTDSYANEMSWDLVNATDAANVITNHTYGTNNGSENLSNIIASCSSCTGNVTTITPIDVSPKLLENLWYHVASTYNGTTGEMKLYLNGELQDTRTGLASTLSTDTNDFEIGRNSELDNNYFEGAIYETRVYSKALTPDQLQKQVYQEIENNSGNVKGTIIPKNIDGLLWSDLELYYKMDIIETGYTPDESTHNIAGGLNNMRTYQERTAPLPYTTTSGGDGNWSNSNNWLHGDVWDISYSHPDWAIVKITEDLSTTTSHNTLGVLLESTKELTINNDSELNISWYLKLDGKIDLEGESQLIQSLNSDLDITSSGTLERDQQGTQDLFTYNYWSSPVGLTNTITNNNSYTVPDIFKDGSDSANPTNINFITSSYDGNSGPPIGIADYWIWKYGNLASDYYNWEHVRSTGSLKAGEGFTMKGVNNTNGNVILEQNYVLEGKPNNGDIILPISLGNEYLVGNPYASAIDANIFIANNTNTTGVLYFWEHWGGGSHVTNQYQGGYAIYNLSGATPAMQYDFVTGGNTGTSGANKLPGRYIPVAQGFFVNGSSNGNIVFNNSQRVFQTEGSNSVFIRNDSYNSTTNDDDNRMKIRLGFDSVSTYHRQLLVTEDNNATPQIDFGYDAETNETQKDDMYWMIDNKKFIIQGIDTIDSTTILPLGIHTDIDGVNSFKIDELINVPSSLEIYIYDTATNTYHDIRNNPSFSIEIPSGTYTDRFELRFSNGNTLSTDDFITEAENIQFYFSNDSNSIVIINPELHNIKSVELNNMLGQTITTFNKIETEDYITLKEKQLSSGVYILTLNTDIGKTSKKILVD